VEILKTLRSRVSDAIPNGSPKSPVHYVCVHAHLSHGQAMLWSCHQRLSSSCDSKLSSTDTSACYHHESHNVIMRLVSLTVSMTDASSCETDGMHGVVIARPLSFNTVDPKWPHRLVSSTIKFYAPQTKIWEGGTKDEMRISKEALFHGSWPKSSTHAHEECFENLDFIFCSSFPNLRL